MKRPLLSRRAVLRGAGGVALGLPLLEAMMPARAQAAGAPPRFVAMYFPDGTYQGTQITGRRMGVWHPVNTGSLTGQALPPALEPLKDNLTDFTVLSSVNNRAGVDGYGVEGAGGHNRAISSFLTSSKQSAPFNTVNIGPSMDQVFADELAKTQTFRRHSLVLGTMAATTAPDSGDVRYMNNVSYRNRTFVPMEKNPRVVFDSLFAGLATGGPPPRDPAFSQSLLDYAKADTARLMGRLGTADQRKVDEYLTSVRELERRVIQAEQAATSTCQLHAAPPTKLAGQYQNDLAADYTLEVDAMIDIIVTAFRCDLTRTASLLLAGESHNIAYSKVVTQPFQGAVMTDGRHIGSAHHEENLEKIKRLISIHQYDVTFFKKMLDKLKAIPETGGTMLDNTIVLFGCGLADGNDHNFENIPVLLGGRGGGIASGRHIAFNKTPLANVQLTLLKHLGVNATSFGEGTGKSTGTVTLT